MSKNEDQKKSVGVSNSVSDVTRHISSTNKLFLCVLSGGRCEFDGCNEYLFSHHLTHKRLNFAQMAHIIAFSEDGPRGKTPDRPAEINNLDNLMLLCHRCHKQIDDCPEEFSRETLSNYKKAHEARIFRLTSAAPDRQTSVLIIKSKIGGQPVKISSAEIMEAVSPRYPATPMGTEIDLSKITDEGAAFYEVAANEIKRETARFVSYVLEKEQTNHISLFALAPMPLLALAGNLLGNKIPLDLFQKHRDAENWTWKTAGEPVEYEFRRLAEGTDNKKVALILSLSGKIHLDQLPPEAVADANLYEITLKDTPPTPNFLRLQEDLTAFKNIYQLALREIGSRHGKLEKIALFPAAPAPIAVLCGRELMPKIDPVLVIYDDDKRTNGYQFILEVNKYD